jgi:hypothetical protein
VVCSWIPNNAFVGFRAMRMGVHNGVITFNVIIIGRLKVMEYLGMKCGNTTLQSFQKMYNVRILKAELVAKLITRKAIQKKRAT